MDVGGTSKITDRMCEIVARMEINNPLMANSEGSREGKAIVTFERFVSSSGSDTRIDLSRLISTIDVLVSDL